MPALSFETQSALINLSGRREGKPIEEIKATLQILKEALSTPEGRLEMAKDAARAALTLPVKAETVAVARLLDPQDMAWKEVPERPLHFNRTPPLYDGDSTDDDSRPVAAAQLIRTGNQDLVARIHWSDPTTNLTATGVRYSDSGTPHIYKRHTETPDQFADAFCLMVPVQRGPTGSFPSLMMGETNRETELYYWRAGQSPQVLSGHGRGTTAAKPMAAQGKAARDGNGWTITLAVPKVSPGTPICFAIWDGGQQHRDGLKFYSLWYEVE